MWWGQVGGVRVGRERQEKGLQNRHHKVYQKMQKNGGPQMLANQAWRTKGENAELDHLQNLQGLL